MEGFGWMSNGIIAALLQVTVIFVAFVASQSTRDVMYGPCERGVCSKNTANALVLGGLFPLHNVVCNGTEVSAESLQWVLAMHNAVDEVNNQNIIGDAIGRVIQLKYEIRDTCRNGPYALNQVLSFVGSSGSCTGGQQSASNIVGVVGPFSSSVSIRVTRLLQLFRIPMVSFGSTSPQLSNKDTYPYFLRTLPSDTFLARAIVRAARARGWTFINVVFTDDAFGRDGSRSVATEAKAAGICIGSMTRLSESATYTNAAGLVEYNLAWTALLDATPQKNSTVTVLFAQETNARNFFLYGQHNNTVRERALDKNITFLGVDSWGDILSAVVNSTGDPLLTAIGAVSPIPFNKIIREFDIELGSLKPNAVANQENNPWLHDAWMNAFNCSASVAACRNDNSFTMRTGYVQSSKVAMVYDAVFAFAYALARILSNSTLCPSQDSSCTSLRDGEVLLRVLRENSFPGKNSNPFFFNNNGDPLASIYAEKNMVVNAANQASFPTVGVYSATETTRNVSGCMTLKDYLYSGGVCYDVSFNSSDGRIVWNDGSSRMPVSICSADCIPGQHRQKQKLDASGNDLTCCWACSDCTNQRFSNVTNSDACLTCDATERVVANRRLMNVQCRILPVASYTITHPLALVVAIQAAITKCAVIAMLVAQVAWWENDKYLPWPLKAIPTAISLVGVFITLVASQLFVLRPTPLICSLHFSLATGGLTLALAPIIIFVWEWYVTSQNVFNEEYSADSTFYAMQNQEQTSQGPQHRPSMDAEDDDEDPRVLPVRSVADVDATKVTDGLSVDEQRKCSGTIVSEGGELTVMTGNITPASDGFTALYWVKSIMAFVLLYAILLGVSLYLNKGDVKDGVLNHTERTLTCSDSGPVVFGFSWVVLLLMMLVCVSLVAIKSIQSDDNTFEADLIKTSLFSVLICAVCVVACTAVYTSGPIAVIRSGSFSLATCLISLSLIGVIHGPRFYYIFRHRIQLMKKFEAELADVALTEQTKTSDGSSSATHDMASQQQSVNTPLALRHNFSPSPAVKESPLVS